MSGNRNEFTSGGGGTPGGSSGSNSDDDNDDDPDPADEFGSELGGDPVESGGSSSSGGSSGGSSDDDDPVFGGGSITDSGSPDSGSSSSDSSSSSSGGGRDPQEAPGGSPNGRQSGGGTLTDQGVGTADRFTPSRDEQAQETADNLRNLGAEARVTEAGTVEFDDPGARDRRVTEQREEFRQEAADELDIAPDDVEITRDGDELRAEPALSNGQAFFDELSGGRLGGVVEAGEDARDAAADIFTDAAGTVGTISAVPATVAAGATRRGLDAVGFEAPAFDTDLDDVGAEAAALGDDALDIGTDAAESFASTTARGAPSQPFLGPDGADLGQREGSLDRATDSVEAGVDAIEAGADAVGERVPDVSPREGAATVRDATGTAQDFLAEGSPGQPLLGPDGAQGVDPEPVEAPGVDEQRNDDGPSFGAEEALALGTAGVVTPEPSTTIGGGVIAGGAALALGASALSRRNEVEVPEDREPVTTELDVGANDADVVEIEPGEIGPSTTEVDFAADGIEAAEIGTPDDTTASGEVDVPTVEAAGIVEPLSEEERDDDILDDEPDFIIDDSVIDDTGPTVEIPEQEQMRQIREELERRQEFVRDDVDDVTTVDREPVRFPGESAEPTVDTNIEAGTFEATEGAFDTAVDGQSGAGRFGGVDPFDATDTATGAASDLDLGVGTVEAPGLDTAQATSPALDTMAQTSTVEATGFEAIETTTPALQSAAFDPTRDDRRRRPRFDLPDRGFDDLDDIGFDVDDAQFEYELADPDFAGGSNDLDVGPNEFDF